MSSKSILIISSCTVSKLVRFFETQCRCCCKASSAVYCRLDVLPRLCDAGRRGDGGPWRCQVTPWRRSRRQRLVGGRRCGPVQVPARPATHPQSPVAGVRQVRPQRPLFRRGKLSSV